MLQVLTESTRGVGPVRLAADLYQRGYNATFDSGDVVGMVTYMLEDLCAQGYVKMRVASNEDDGAPAGYHGLPYDIRLTPKGWETVGYPHVHSEVGRSPGTREVNPEDSTDYRTHHSSAQWAPVERLLWWQHWALYPWHIHNYDLFIQQEEELMARSYVKVTPDMEERVIVAYAKLGDYAQTAAETGVSDRQVRYIVKDRPVLGRDMGSLKQRALTLITERGPYADISGLHADLPGPHGLHNLVHILHSLHKANLIDFQEAKTNGSGTNYLNIHAVTTPVRASQAVTTEETETPQLNGHDYTVEVENAVAPTYPELAQLVERSAKYKAESKKAEQYMLAAEVLAGMDDETAELLLTKATEVAHTALSPVESEYLRYSEAHPDGQD